MSKKHLAVTIFYTGLIILITASIELFTDEYLKLFVIMWLMATTYYIVWSFKLDIKEVVDDWERDI